VASGAVGMLGAEAAEEGSRAAGEATLLRRLMTERATAAAEGFLARGAETVFRTRRRPGLGAAAALEREVDPLAGLAERVGLRAAGRRLRPSAAAVRAASAFLRACFASFLVCLESLRAFFSSALASRTFSLAAAARVPAFSASVRNLRKVALSGIGFDDERVLATMIAPAR